MKDLEDQLDEAMKKGDLEDKMIELLNMAEGGFNKLATSLWRKGLEPGSDFEKYHDACQEYAGKIDRFLRKYHSERAGRGE